jgi:hypothetical protein
MDWTKVINTPLGLAGFALALIFGVIAKWGPRYPKWLMPTAIILAAATMIFGLVISLRPSPQLTERPSGAEVLQKNQNNTIHVDQQGTINAETQGPCSAAQVGVNIGGDQNTQCEVQDNRSKSADETTKSKKGNP